MPPLLSPTADEQEQDYISRFMASPGANEEFPDETNRKNAAIKAYAEQKNSIGEWPTSFKCSYIEPGLVAYADVGTVLVRKEVLDKMANSFIGKPVVNEEHKDVSPADFRLGKADGIINSVWYNSEDGKFHCAYQVWDGDTRKNINNGYKVSCAYRVLRWGPGGIHNNVPYDKEVLDGEYTHLAIVSNPRYEDVKIYNKGGRMKLTWLQKILSNGKEETKSHEIETTNSKVMIGEKEVSLDECLNAYKEQLAEKEKEEALKNSVPKDTDVVDLGNGVKATVGDLKAAYAAKNAEEDEKKKKDEKDKENAKIANTMKEDHEDGKHDKDEKENCPMCNALKNKKGANHFDVIDALANTRSKEKAGASLDNSDLGEFKDGFAEGRRLFGSDKKTA